MDRASLKSFLRRWVVPPGYVEARLARRMEPLRQLQKFWAGSPLDPLGREAAYFRDAGLQAQVLTRADDSRTAGRVETRATLTVDAGAGAQLAVVAETPWTGRQSVTIRSGTASVTHALLSARAWLDIRIDAADGEILVETTAPIWVTMPRPVRLAPAAQSGIRHVLVLVLDGWSSRMAGTTHPTEPNLPLTPHIDRFFAGGLSCARAFSSAEWTMPTVASFATGVCTSRHRCFHPTRPYLVPSDRTLLSEYFQAAGYHTLGLTTGNRITPAYGHHRGYDRYIYHWPSPGHTERDYDPAVWIAEITGHLDVHQHDRTYTYAHLPDTHPAWHIPPATRAFNLQRRGDSTGLDLEALDRSPLAVQQGTQLNLLRLHELDRMLGGLFHFIETTLDDSTLVVLTADHGTPWHHLRSTRPKDEPYLVDDRTTTMFMMRGGPVPARTLESLATPNLDLMPTLFGAAGLPVPPDLDGRDLRDPAYHRDHVVSESIYGGVYEIAVRDGNRAYIEKYPFDEAAFRTSGAAIYAKLFRQGTPDYASALDEDPGRLRELAHAHMRRMGILGGGAV
jgi:arylsulfatase A-like enzyme